VKFPPASGRIGRAQPRLFRADLRDAAHANCGKFLSSRSYDSSFPSDTHEWAISLLKFRFGPPRWGVRSLEWPQPPCRPGPVRRRLARPHEELLYRQGLCRRTDGLTAERGGFEPRTYRSGPSPSVPNLRKLRGRRPSASPIDRPRGVTQRVTRTPLRPPRRLGSGRRGRVRVACKLVPVFALSFPRRQQARRLRRAATSGSAAIVAGALAATAASVGATALAGLLALVMAALVLDARRWVRLAARSRVGARSEGEVRRELAGLEAEGWRLRHSLPCGGRGDIDSVAIAPTGLAFAIESKTRTFDQRHLAHARQTAAWLYRHRRRWCRRGALPVLCVVRARGFEGTESGVLVVSLDRLAPALRAGAGTSPRPGFLATSPSPS